MDAFWRSLVAVPRVIKSNIGALTLIILFFGYLLLQLAPEAHPIVKSVLIFIIAGFFVWAGLAFLPEKRTKADSEKNQ